MLGPTVAAAPITESTALSPGPLISPQFLSAPLSSSQLLSAPLSSPQLPRFSRSAALRSAAARFSVGWSRPVYYECTLAPSRPAVAARRCFQKCAARWDDQTAGRPPRWHCVCIVVLAKATTVRRPGRGGNRVAPSD